jgi:arginine repressor
VDTKDTPIYIQLEPKYVNFINRIMEGYEYLGVVSTLNRKEGIVVIRATPDTAEEVHKILNHLPIDIRYVEH